MRGDLCLTYQEREGEGVRMDGWMDGRREKGWMDGWMDGYLAHTASCLASDCRTYCNYWKHNIVCNSKNETLYYAIAKKFLTELSLIIWSASSVLLIEVMCFAHSPTNSFFILIILFALQGYMPKEEVVHKYNLSQFIDIIRAVR